jgi:uncharacterized protein YndB with AHSA1/START domain
MADVTAQALIAAPAGKVWEQLTDFAGYGRWNATHTGFPGGGPAPLAPEAVYVENMRLMGFPAEVTWTVAELEPERVLGTTGKGPMGVTLAMRYSLTPEGDRTTVRVDGTFTGAAVALMAAKLKESATSALNESLRKLALIVE